MNFYSSNFVGWDILNGSPIIRDVQNEKRDLRQLPHSPPSEVKGVRIVISFRNIAKKKTTLCQQPYSTFPQLI